jgi:hypothetical protein
MRRRNRTRTLRTYELSLEDKLSPKENRESEDKCNDDSREVIEGKGGETLKAALRMHLSRGALSLGAPH